MHGLTFTAVPFDGLKNRGVASTELYIYKNKCKIKVKISTLLNFILIELCQLLWGIKVTKIKLMKQLLSVWTFLHQIPPGVEGHDKLYKIRSFMNLRTDQFYNNYTPNEYATIDEA